MIYVQIKTEAGTVYQVNVIDQKFRRITKSGEASVWTGYQQMTCKGVGDVLTMVLSDGRTLGSTVVTGLEFPKSEEK